MTFFTKFTKSSLIGFMLASSSVFAVEPAMGWYAGFMLGASYAPSQDFTIYNTPFFQGPRVANVSYNILGNFGGQFGYRCNKFRYEAELVYNRNKIKDITVGGFTLNNDPTAVLFPAGGNIRTRIKGNTSLAAAFFNAYYEFYDEDYAETSFVPYVGLGLGYANVKNNASFETWIDPIHTHYRNSVSGNAPIGQAILGINYFFSDNVSLGTDFRYMKSKNINAFDSSVSIGTWNILVMNFSFDQPAY